MTEHSSAECNSYETHNIPKFKCNSAKPSATV